MKTLAKRLNSVKTDNVLEKCIAKKQTISKRRVSDNYFYHVFLKYYKVCLKTVQTLNDILFHISQSETLESFLNDSVHLA